MLNAQTAEYKQPEFTLNLAITGVGVDVRLNDISIEFEMFSGHSTMSYDVNESIIAGVNELKVVAFPFFGKTRSEGQTKNYHEEAEIIATLYINEQDQSNNKQVLTQIHLKPTLALGEIARESSRIEGLSDVVIDDKSQPLSFSTIPIERQIVATRKSLPVQSNYPRWAWQDGKVIEDTQENYDSLLEYYREIYEAYEKKDRSKLFALQDHAAEEFSVAYRLKGGVAAGHKFIETGEILDERDVKLVKFHSKGTKLDVFADGKMARIISIAQYHPVVFRNQENGLIHKLKFSFYKNKQNEWIMIR